jgi:peptidoglycan biosynthesis protein MviN/MurJ (putative lipid II flippase)
LMRRHLGKLESRTMLQMLVRLSVASLVLAAICWAGMHFLLSNWATAAFLPKAGSLALVIAAGAAAFFLCATALGISELREITQAVKRRLLRRV